MIAARLPVAAVLLAGCSQSAPPVPVPVSSPASYVGKGATPHGPSRPAPGRGHKKPPKIGRAVQIVRGDPTASQWAALAWCESGRDRSAGVNSTEAARGIYKFLPSTWRSVGGRGDPAAATKAEQLRRAVLLYRRDGWSPWTCRYWPGVQR